MECVRLRHRTNYKKEKCIKEEEYKELSANSGIKMGKKAKWQTLD